MMVSLPIFQAFVGGSNPLPKLVYLGSFTGSSGSVTIPVGGGLCVLCVDPAGAGNPTGFSAVAGGSTSASPSMWQAPVTAGGLTIAGMNVGNTTAVYCLQYLISTTPVSGTGRAPVGAQNFPFTLTGKTNGIAIACVKMFGSVLSSWGNMTANFGTGGNFAAGSNSNNVAGTNTFQINQSTTPSGGADYSAAAWR